jgi:hypothetical protein
MTYRMGDEGARAREMAIEPISKMEIKGGNNETV